ncbi:MAG: CotH kinase family protein [Flavobacteriales bacterium]|nr:CotH kinase family protein [Flavobacteriales bacterium]
MRLLRCLPLLLALGFTVALRAQGDFYAGDAVRELRLYFPQADWRTQLEALYLAGENGRLLGDINIDGTLLRDVGVRFKGYSSFSTGRIKNPFNIELDEVHSGQNYQGFEKLKLSNVTSDPSFLREVLTYDVARCYMPASRSNFANVYVNDTLLGLYTNVEEVGKDFVEQHLGARGNSFFKGNPTTVSLTGANSNLGQIPGADSTAYYSLYKKESRNGWGHLMELIEVLNNDPDNVEQVLNVDRALWMHAINYTLINFDSYVGYAQNYYLYRDNDGLWNPILWDLNMSFASFRLTDASQYWNGFSIAQAITMDPLMHHNSVSVFPRPLLRNLFQNPMYRRMYLAHIRTIVEEHFANGSYRERAEDYRTLIAAHVQADTNKFFSYQQFLDNLDLPVQGITQYPGIAQLMDQRAAWLATYPGYAAAPSIGVAEHAPATVQVGGQLTITLPIADADTAFLAYRFNTRGAFQKTALFDDGLHGDGGAGDGVYGATITAGSNLVQFYVYAENNTAGAFSPARAAHETHSIQTRIAPAALVINEVVASNNGQVLNEPGDAEDWIELFNPGPNAISTAGLYLSDDPANSTKWALPLRTLLPGEFLTVWADERGSLGELHANFKLSASGETLQLAYDDSTVIDRVSFGPQYPVSSYGRYPNGSGTFRELSPSFGTYNRMELGANLDRPLLLYPNPATTEVNVVCRVEGPLELQVFRSDGRAATPVYRRSTNELVRITTLGLGAGHYVLQCRSVNGTLQQPFIILQ